MQLKKIVCISLIAASVLLAQTGCGKMELANPEDGYSTNYALSAIEYNIFLNKQIGVAENVLATRLSMANSVAGGTYEPEKEIVSAEEAISKIEDIKDEITVTMPATNYENDRQNALDLIEDSLLVLNDYLDALNSNDQERIETCAVQMKDCYIALSGEANAYYE